MKGNKNLKMFVREEYLDEDGNWQVDELPLEKWAEIISKKNISSLYYIEEFLSEKLGKQITLSKDFPQIRKPILNTSGSIQRLPQKLIIKNNNSSDKTEEFFIEFGNILKEEDI